VKTNTTTRLKGVIRTGGILERILHAKAARIEEAKRRAPIEKLVEFARAAVPARREASLAEAISKKGATNVIAEIKRRSPSKGIIREGFLPVEIAASYERAGAAALSVLAEEDFFGGSLDHLREARARVRVPLLRKDFIFDEYQLYESIEAGADAVLLIAAMLDDDLLGRLINLAGDLNLDALVEVHTDEEMERAARAGARIIGVNNRDLTTFDVDLKTSIRLAALAPAGATLVSESGISSGADIRRLRDAGFDAFLIGEHFMRAADPGAALTRLIEEAESCIK
jgi:indole-3-glycerol phosphate synthase